MLPMLLQIVTAELKAESNRDVVIYKIRVGDDTGEWTVSRRFRNFETLHRALRYTLLLVSTAADSKGFHSHLYEAQAKAHHSSHASFMFLKELSIAGSHPDLEVC